MVNQKQYQDYKDGGPELGPVPAHWNITKMGRLGRATSGGTPSKDDASFWGGDIPWVSAKDMKRRYIASSEDSITERGLADAGLRLVEPSSVLVVVRGMILAHTLPVAIATCPLTINQDMKALRLQDHADPEFVAWLLEGIGKRLLSQIVEEAAHGTKAIRMDQWRNVMLALPPRTEQHAIAQFLDRQTAAIDALIAKKGRLLELLQETRSALITQTVTRGLNPNAPMKESGVVWLDQIPAHWDLGNLSRFWKVIDCKHRTATYVDEGIPIVSTTEVKPGRLVLNGRRRVSQADFDDLISGDRRPKRGDVVYSRNASLGSAAYVDSSTPFCMGQDVCLITSPFDNRYLCYQLNSSAVLGQIEEASVGSTFDRINIAQINNFWVAHPPVQEQNEVARFLDAKTVELDRLVTIVQRARQLLAELRMALICDAVTCKIDVRTAAREL